MSTCILQVNNMNTRQSSPFVETVVKTDAKLISDLSVRNGCTDGEPVVKDELGNWAEDSCRIRDIRMRWLMQFMAEYYKQLCRPASDRVMMCDIYDWVMKEKPALEDFVHHPCRASFVHRVLSDTTNDRPTDALRKDDIVLSIEAVFEVLAGELTPSGRAPSVQSTTEPIEPKVPSVQPHVPLVNPRQILQESIRQNNRTRQTLLAIMRDHNTTLSAIPSLPFANVQTGPYNNDYYIKNMQWSSWKRRRDHVIACEQTVDPYLLSVKSLHDSILLQNKYLQEVLASHSSI
jgi:hypothetical protein